MAKLTTELGTVEGDQKKHKRLKDRIDRLERFSDIRNHFYDSGFEAWPGENPDLQIYELVETIVGARWVSLDLLSIVFFYLQLTDSST